MELKAIPDYLSYYGVVASNGFRRATNLIYARTIRGSLLFVLAVYTASLIIGFQTASFNRDNKANNNKPSSIRFSFIQETGLYRMTRTEIENLIGQPTERFCKDEFLKRILVQYDLRHPSIDYGRDLHWDKWVDPDLQERWVAVLYAHDRAVDVRNHSP